jgi:hypothetical protein
VLYKLDIINKTGNVCKHNIGASSSSQCCAKAVSNKCNECVCVCVCICILAIFTWLANHIISALYYIVICDLSGSIMFFPVTSSEWHDFLGKNYWAWDMFLFYLQLPSVALLILRRIQRAISLNVHKTPVILFRF